MNNIQYTEKEELNQLLKASYEAFLKYSGTSRKERAEFLSEIKVQLLEAEELLIQTAAEETNLKYSRLKSEFKRTINQLKFFKEMLLEGSYLEISIDKAIPERSPIPKPDIRKIMQPMGPVVVFGAGNFPFAYSTMGGDSSSALAAGCSLIVKAHPAHPRTSELVADCIRKAVMNCGMPENVFTHIHFKDMNLGKELVMNEYVAAVGFTGSHKGGRVLFDYAAKRGRPIPVFAEMGSTNPVVLLPEYLKNNTDHLVKIFTGSITGSMGQFCTKPGIFLGIESEQLDKFAANLAESLNSVLPEKMLYENIVHNYNVNRSMALEIEEIQVLTKTFDDAEAAPTIVLTKGEIFRNNKALQEEVFGPFSVIVSCKNYEELIELWTGLQGQLTTSLFGTEDDFEKYSQIPVIAARIAGRIIFNQVPTGVEVCPSMMHGGPYPATTDSRFTAVGIHSVKRWLRPVCYQNAPLNLLPQELRV